MVLMQNLFVLYSSKINIGVYQDGQRNYLCIFNKRWKGSKG